jgi:hypothetical protein
MLMMAQPGFSLGPLPAVLLIAVVLYLMRDELRDVMSAVPDQRKRFATASFVAICLAVLFASPVFAQDVLIPSCSWAYLLEQCSGYESCAWALWVSFGCWVIPG